MTYASAIATGNVNQIEATLIIDGIPILFATNGGTTVTTSGWFNAGPSSMVTVDAIERGSLSLEGGTLDFDQMMVPPAGGSIVIRGSLLWDKYFERRRAPSTRLITAVNSGASTTFSVESSSGFSTGTVLFCDRETCTINGVSSPGTLSSLNRNHYQLKTSKESAHQIGAAVSNSPPSILGRWAELRFHVGDQSYLERRMIIDSIKRKGVTGNWEITFRDMMSVVDRQIGNGWTDLKIDTFAWTNTDDTPAQALLGLTTYEADDLPQTYNNGMHVIVRYGDNGSECAIGEVHWVLGSTFYLRVDNASMNNLRDWLNAGSNAVGFRGSATMSVVYRLDGNPATDILRVLLSEKGDGYVDSNYDNLIGETISGGLTSPLTYGVQERRFGAGLPLELVDVDAFEDPAFSARTMDGWCYWLGSGGPENLRDFLEEAAWAARGYICIRNGKISIKPITGISAVGGTDDSATDSELIRNDGNADSIDDESEIVNQVDIKCNLDVPSDQLIGAVTLKDMRLWDTYKDTAKPISLERRGLVVDDPRTGLVPGSQPWGIPASINTLTQRMDRILARRMRGVRKYTLTLPFKYHLLQPGDTITVTSVTLPDFAGGTLSAQALEIVSTGGIDFERGLVTFQAYDTWSTYAISPTSVVDSWLVATATLETSHRYGGGTTPGTSLWGVGWKVRILDASSLPPFSTKSGALVISGTTATTVTFTGVVGFTPAAGDLLIQDTYDTSDNTTEVDGADQRDHVFLADDNGRIGSGNVVAYTYG